MDSVGLSDRGDTGDSGLLLSKYSSSNLQVHTFTYENMGNINSPFVYLKLGYVIQFWCHWAKVP